jgi:hypothetical protein
MVPVFSEEASFIRKILQGEENKGVELTGAVGTACGRGRVRAIERKRNVNYGSDSFWKKRFV